MQQLRAFLLVSCSLAALVPAEVLATFALQAATGSGAAALVAPSNGFGRMGTPFANQNQLNMASRTTGAANLQMNQFSAPGSLMMGSSEALSAADASDFDLDSFDESSRDAGNMAPPECYDKIVEQIGKLLKEHNSLSGVQSASETMNQAIGEASASLTGKFCGDQQPGDELASAAGDALKSALNGNVAETLAKNLKDRDFVFTLLKETYQKLDQALTDLKKLNRVAGGLMDSSKDLAQAGKGDEDAMQMTKRLLERAKNVAIAEAQRMMKIKLKGKAYQAAGHLLNEMSNSQLGGALAGGLRLGLKYPDDATTHVLAPILIEASKEGAKLVSGYLQDQKMRYALVTINQEQPMGFMTCPQDDMPIDQC